MAGIVGNLKTIDDYRRAEEEFQLRKQKAMADKSGALPATLQVAGAIKAALDNGDVETANRIMQVHRSGAYGVNTYGDPTGQAIQPYSLTPQKASPQTSQQNLLEGLEGLVNPQTPAAPAWKNPDVQPVQPRVATPTAGIADVIAQAAGKKSGAQEQGQSDVKLIMEPNIKAATTARDLKSKAQTEAQINLPKTEFQTQNALNLLESIGADPGLSAVVGLPEITQGRIPFIGNVPGSPAADFQAKLDQLGGKQFLEAFESLKGGGAITEVEGKKATNAIGRMQTSQSEKAFREALAELEGVVRSGVERARTRSQEVIPTGGKVYPAEAAAAKLPKIDLSKLDPRAVKDLQNNPASAPQFDEIFGEGAARRILGNGIK